MRYQMRGFSGEPIDDCMARGGSYTVATDTCECPYGININNAKCITAEEYRAMNSPTNSGGGGGSGGGGVVTPQYQESWVSKNKSWLIGAGVIVAVIVVVKYAGN